MSTATFFKRYHDAFVPRTLAIANEDHQTRELELVSVLFSLFLKLCLEKTHLEANVLTSVGEKLFRD